MLRSLAAFTSLVVAVGPAGAQQAACPIGTLPAYAHNDYANTRPLADALTLGFRGVEVDVFLVDGELRVGHDRRSAHGSATFEWLYLAPLRDVLARCGSLRADGHSFLLTVELKEESEATYVALLDVVARHRVLLVASATSATGRASAEPAVKIVLVGWHPHPTEMNEHVDSLFGIQHRLSDPSPQGALDARVRLLSLDYGKTMGRWWVTATARRRWLAALRAVKTSVPGRLLRVHNVPADAGVYALLLAAGVDLVGSTQLDATRRLLSAAP